jgi:MFS family permease
LVPLGRRGTAYGILNAILGFGTLASGVIFGYFLDKGYSVIILVGFALVLQIGAILTLSRYRKLSLNAHTKKC